MNLDNLSAEELARLDAVCLQFESNLREGVSVSIDDLVQRYGGDQDVLRAELSAIQDEIQQASRRESKTPFTPTTSQQPTEHSAGAAVTQVLDGADSVVDDGLAIGPYQVTGRLGHGGMGIVYDAIDTRLDRKVAIKMLNVVGNKRQELMDRFEHEAKAVAALTHPNIVELFDVGVADGTPYAVMEYLDGETLAERIDREPMPVAQVRKLGAAIAEALAFAHENGVVHRDLKPQNVMLIGKREGKDARVKLFDFGLSRIPRESPGDSDKTKAGMILGTPGYMAPEQARGDAATPAADVFGLGCVLYEAFYAKKAIAGSTVADRLAATLGDPPSPDPDRRREDLALANLIQRCLAKEPAHRPSAHEVAESLHQDPSQRLVLVETSSGQSHIARRRFLMSAAGGICGAIAGALVAQSRAKELTDIRSIAVLSIKDLTPKQGEAPMPGDGRPLGIRKMDRGQQIAASLVNELARLPDFAVPPFRPLKADLPSEFVELGEQLGVDAFLTGTVQTTTTGTQLHTELNLQIVSAEDGRQLWSDRFVTEAGDNLMEQSRFAKNIAGTIGRRLTTTAEETSAPDAMTYMCLMDGKARSDPDSVQGLERALMCFEKAKQFDARCPCAVAGVALTSITLAAQSNETKALEYIQQARTEMEKALQLEPGSIEGRLAKAMLQWQTLLHYEEAKADLRELAMVAANNWQVQHQYGLLLLATGDQSAAMRALRDASRLNPHSIMVKVDYVRAQWISGNTQRAISDAIRYRNQFDRHPLTRGLLVDIYEQQQQWDKAAAEHDEFGATPRTSEAYFGQRQTKLADLPYGPFGELMNQAILDGRRDGIDDDALGRMSDSQSPMFPLLLAVHPALSPARLLPRAKDSLLPTAMV